jgi:hypothetical protein
LRGCRSETEVAIKKLRGPDLRLTLVSPSPDFGRLDDRTVKWEALSVAIGSWNPALSALNRALRELVAECEAACAAVIDDGNGLWCTSRPGFDSAADRFYREEIAACPDVQLKRGVRLRVVRQDPPDRAYVAESFASIYVVVLWFDRAFDPFTARSRVRSALPRIEALTIALPPPSGPEAGAGAGKARA